MVGLLLAAGLLLGAGPGVQPVDVRLKVGAMGKNPAFLFYPHDWTGDPALQRASAASRGIWINLLCRMWWSDPRGTLTATPEQFCRLANCTGEEWEAFCVEAQRDNFADVTLCPKNVTVTNRRMRRDDRTRELARLRKERERSKRDSHASVTFPSSVSVSVSVSEADKTLATVVAADRDAPGPVDTQADLPIDPPWPDQVADVKARLLEMQAPDDLMDPVYWLRIDQWIEGTTLPVYYLDELKAYLAHQASTNGRRRHRDRRAGFRNWLATALRWKERDAQRAQQQRARAQ